ncbi:MAG: MFS transporter [Prevotella sp.]|nr:MFS transporter [Prevotella sp.]
MEEKTEKLWNRDFIKVMTANFSLFFAFYLLTPLLPLYLHEAFGATKDTIGVMLSGYTLAALLTRPFSGFIVDTFNRKKVLMTCFFLFFVFFAGYLAAGTLLMFAIVRTLHGSPYGALTVANSTVAIDVLPSSRRNEGIGFYGLSNNLSMAIAPSIGIWIYKASNNFELLFWLALIVAGFGLLVDSTVKVPTNEIVRNKSKLSLDRFFLTRAWLLAINIALFGFCFGVLSNYLAIYSKQVLGITSGTGTHFMLLSIGLFVSRLQGAAELRKGHMAHNAAEGIVISLIGYTLFASTAHFSSPLMVNIGYYGSAILIGLGNGHMYPAFLNMFINVAKHSERGTANSSILTSWDIGFGIGILLGGIVSEHLGYSAAFWMVAVDNAIGSALFFLATRNFFERRRLR